MKIILRYLLPPLLPLPVEDDANGVHRRKTLELELLPPEAQLLLWFTRGARVQHIVQQELAKIPANISKLSIEK